jgi:hypothetical protein
MATSPIQASEIEIGRLGNRVFYDADGSMCFADKYVSKVRLVELLKHSGDSSDSEVVEITTGSWALDHHDNVFNRDFWYVEFILSTLGFANDTKLITRGLVVKSPSPLITEEISFDEVLLYSNKIRIISSEKIHCFLIIEPA